MILRDESDYLRFLQYTLHSAKQPSVVWPDGSSFWFLNDEQHRYYGPARFMNNVSDGLTDNVINGVAAWYIHGDKII